MTTRGKKYEAVAELIDREKAYEPKEAVELVKKTARASFDETIELHLRMALDPRNAAQQVRGVALLPNGLGKPVRVLVFAQGEAEKIAQQAGADFVGGDDLVKKVEEGWTEFDIAMATPEMMGKVGKLGKVLGRKGLMPNPKSGTVVNFDRLANAVKDARKGRVEFKLDRTAIIHVIIGKASFSVEQLYENLASIVESIVKAKPAGAKGNYVKSAFLKTTMGPAIKLDLNTTLTLTTGQ